MSTFLSHLLKRSCVIVGGGVAPLALAAGGASAADCGSLGGKTFGAAHVTAATSVSPPSSLVNIDFPMGPVAITTPFCRVQGVSKPSADSDIRFEVWLPTENAWNGKYQGVGNGGFAGSLLYVAMARALEGGYAVSATDTGHPGGALEAAWALGHPEKIADFGWRGIHEAASVSKGIVQALREGSCARLFQRLLGRRPGGAYGGAAVPARLGRDRRRRAGEFLDETAVQRDLDRAGHLQAGELAFA